MPLLQNHPRVVRNAAPISGQRTRFSIEGVQGLVLDVTPNGSRTWYVRYAVRRGGQRRWRNYRIGSLDRVTLGQAIDKAREVLAAVEYDKRDPVGERLNEQGALTFRQLAEMRLSQDNRIGDGSRRNYRWTFERHVFPEIGEVPADRVMPEEIVALLDSIVASGHPRQADLTKAAIGSTYKWGLKRQRVKRDPTGGLGNRASPAPRRRVLTDEEMRALWRVLDANDVWCSPAMRIIVKLALLTGQRRTEVAGAKKAELRLASSAPTWVIPVDQKRGGDVIKGRTKNKIEQRVPLSRQAIELFRQALSLAGSNDHVFPANVNHVSARKAPRTPHINGGSVSLAMRRLREAAGIDDVTIHDARRCIATWLGDRGVRAGVIDRILNHKPIDVTGRHYNHAEMDHFVREALQDWADHVEQITLSSGAMVAR
jgi:integrase